MLGVMLCGGSGEKFGAFAKKVTNKHLAVCYNKPMIDFPMNTIRGAGLRDMAVVTSERSAGDIVRYLGDGREFGLDSIRYYFQSGESGIADALRQVGKEGKRESVAVILGDNLFEEAMKNVVEDFKKVQGGVGARIVLKFVPDPERFGVASIKDGKVVDVEEKPKSPKSSLAVTGFYVFDERVFDIIETLKPSGRGEYEIADVIAWYMRQGQLGYHVTDGFWTDLGTYDSLLVGSNWVRNSVNGQCEENVGLRRDEVRDRFMEACVL